MILDRKRSASRSAAHARVRGGGADLPVPKSTKAAGRRKANIAGRRTAQAAARREAILAAALDEFSARGFAAARLDDVAARAGVAKGTIYLHFKDKESLFQDLIRSRMGPVVGTLEAVFAADIPLHALVDQAIEIFVREV